MTSTETRGTHIEADADLPVIRIRRDFRATPEQLFRAHTDPQLFVRWVGPADMSTEVDQWDAQDGGSYRFRNLRGGEEYAFRGCFHTVRADRIVQTFTFCDIPDAVSLETMTFTDLGDGRARLESTALMEDFAARDAMLASGMETGLDDGYAALQGMVDDGTA